jgi:hypothetical protein
MRALALIVVSQPAPAVELFMIMTRTVLLISPKIKKMTDHLSMKNTWTHKGKTPAGADIYHKGRWIIQVYQKRICLWHVPEGKDLYAANADFEQVRIKGKGTDRILTYRWYATNQVNPVKPV